MMTEKEYIDATNLTKLRSAELLVRDCLPTSPGERSAIGGIIHSINLWSDVLNERVKVDSSDPTSGFTPSGGTEHG
jgi:hypothetical protein